jgi:hypothetical protein
MQLFDLINFGSAFAMPRKVASQVLRRGKVDRRITHTNITNADGGRAKLDLLWMVRQKTKCTNSNPTKLPRQAIHLLHLDLLREYPDVVPTRSLASQVCYAFGGRVAGEWMGRKECKHLLRGSYRGCGKVDHDVIK